MEVANEFGHSGFDHAALKHAAGQIDLIKLAKKIHPDLLVSTSDVRNGLIESEVADVSDFILVHFNGTSITAMPSLLEACGKFGKPVICNEDTKTGDMGAHAAQICVSADTSWGLMLEKTNQHFPFAFHGYTDDEVVYRAIKSLTTP